MCRLVLPHAHAWGYMPPPHSRFVSAAAKTANAVAACSHRRKPVDRPNQEGSRECGERSQGDLLRIIKLLICVLSHLCEPYKSGVRGQKDIYVNLGLLHRYRGWDFCYLIPHVPLAKLVARGANI